MKYEVTYKGGKKEILEQVKLPKFSANFNRMVRELRIDEKMYDIDSMIEIRRVE